MVAATSSAVSGPGNQSRTRSEAIPRRFVENVDSLNSVADTWSEDRKRFRLIVPNIERGVNYAWRNKDKVACAKNLLLLVKPLLDLAAENEHHLFLIGMIVEALPFAGEYDAFQDGEAFGLGLSRAVYLIGSVTAFRSSSIGGGTTSPPAAPARSCWNNPRDATPRPPWPISCLLLRHQMQ